MTKMAMGWSLTLALSQALRQCDLIGWVFRFCPSSIGSQTCKSKDGTSMAGLEQRVQTLSIIVVKELRDPIEAIKADCLAHQGGVYGV
jgi:hypothetical protein